MLNHPRHAQYVLRDNSQNYHKGGAMWDYFRTILGNGLIVTEGDFWLRQRRMMQPQFHRQRLAALTDLMIDAIDETLTAWDAHRPEDEPFDMVPGLSQLTMNVIVKTLFGTHLPTYVLAQVSDAVRYLFDYMLQGMLVISTPDWLPLPGKKKYRRAQTIFDEMSYKVIAQCRREGTADQHLLGMLLDLVDEETGEGMTDQQLRDEIATMFMAGYETTAVALSWAMEYLTLDPALLSKLRAEIDSVVGDRRPEIDDLPRLTYARMVFQESLRHRPPAFWLPRAAVADDEIDGYPIPAGTNLVLLNYMFHHHPECWPDPDRFDPERFTPEEVAERHKFAWVPFGGGRRLCIGRDFAIMEGQLALAMILQRYNLERLPGHTAQVKLSTTLRPKNGVRVYLTNRGK
jgi:cytochrome P450